MSTKLYIPPSRRGQVLRPRLQERLDAGLRRKLTLVSAPAGFGKTTLVSEWVQGKPDVAWVSLDVGDNEPAQFWRYVVTALQTLSLPMQNALGLSRTQPGATQRLLASLINDLASAAPAGRGEGRDTFVLVLDDYHLIDSPTIHEGLDYLLDHLPPALHIILITREDPPLALSRLRGRGQLVEVRATDLRFTPQETDAFLNRAMGLDLSPDEIAALDRRTEGWIVGLQMAALSLQGQSYADRRRFVNAFAGDDRYVADYLVDEVLRGQPPEIQRFLLQTSVLNRLCGPLCDAVLGGTGMRLPERELVATHPGFLDRPASPSQAVLENLLESNLFIVCLDSRRRWFRYHRLFSELLSSRLQESAPEQAVENHLRASEWYEAQGYVSEAISHTLAAAALSKRREPSPSVGLLRAADLLEQHSEQIVRRGEFGQYGAWLDALPEAIVRARPLLCMARAWSQSIASDVPVSETMNWMERALELAAANPRPLSHLEARHRTDYELIRENATVFRVGFARTHRDPREIVELCQEALDALPEEAAFGRGIVTFWLAQTYEQLDEWDAAERAFERVWQIGQAAEGALLAFVVSGAQARHAWEHGDLPAVAQICRDAMASLVRPAEQEGWQAAFACAAYIYLGRTLIEWNELEEAEPLLVRGIELAERAGERVMRVDACRDMALLHWIQGEYAVAHAWMDKAMQACHEDPGYLEALRARIWLAQAEADPHWLDAAVRWADGCALDPYRVYNWEEQTFARVRIAQYRARGEPDLAPLLAFLDERIATHPRSSSGWYVQVRAIKALLLDTMGRRDEAMQPLEEALAVARETGRVLVWLEHGPPMYSLLCEAAHRDIEPSFARRVLDAFVTRGRARARRRAPDDASSTQTAGGEPQDAWLDPLSERERQVLRLLATTLSGPEIADELMISLGTFRSHTKHIYSKLDVHSRLDAVARAQALGLLTERD